MFSKRERQGSHGEDGSQSPGDPRDITLQHMAVLRMSGAGSCSSNEDRPSLQCAAVFEGFSFNLNICITEFVSALPALSRTGTQAATTEVATYTTPFVRPDLRLRTSLGSSLLRRCSNPTIHHPCPPPLHLYSASRLHKSGGESDELMPKHKHAAVYVWTSLRPTMIPCASSAGAPQNSKHRFCSPAGRSCVASFDQDDRAGGQHGEGSGDCCRCVTRQPLGYNA